MRNGRTFMLLVLGASAFVVTGLPGCVVAEIGELGDAAVRADGGMNDAGGASKDSGMASDAGTTSGGDSGMGGTDASTTADASVSTYDCQHPASAWLLCDDFEAMSGGYDAWRTSGKWTENIGATDPGRMTSSNEAHTGHWALHMPAAASSGYQGADLVYRWCQGTNRENCTLSGATQLYFRAYVKFAADHQRTHHFLSVGGSQSYYDLYGNAGCRPNGSKATGTTVDFAANTHDSYFYTYFPGMSCDSATSCNRYSNAQNICDGCATRGLPCLNGPECCWGNEFYPTPHVALPLDRWFCLEMTMKLNDVGQANGSMAYWVDGALANEKKGMNFRSTEGLKLNAARLQHYNETEDVNGHSNRVWFDDVVISTERIGCL